MSYADNERRRIIMQDEADRAYAREQYALRRGRQAQEQVNRDEQRRRYFAYHGNEGVFRITVVKWAIAAAVLACVSFFGSIGDDGFFKALGDAFLCFLVIAGIGVVRAYHLVNSVR